MNSLCPQCGTLIEIPSDEHGMIACTCGCVLVPCPRCGGKIVAPESDMSVRCATCDWHVHISIQESIADSVSDADPEEEDRFIGCRIDSCQIESILGRGSMGKVFLATHLKLNIYVALKVLQQSRIKIDTDHQTAVNRFAQEAEVGKILNHPNIVRVYDVGKARIIQEDGSQREWDEYYYLAMEYMKGGTLQAKLDQCGRFSVEEALRAMIQIADALEAARKLSIIHRDIKPDNLLYDEQGWCKLSDFGVAKDLKAKNRITGSEDVILGTPHYMAPEQILDTRKVDHRSDLYALGCSFFHLLTGHSPYDGETPFVVLNKHVYAPLPPMNAFPDTVSMGLRKTLLRLMEKNPENRFQTAGELSEHLKALSRGDSAYFPDVDGLWTQERWILPPMSNEQLLPPVSDSESPVESNVSQKAGIDSALPISNLSPASAMVPLHKISTMENRVAEGNENKRREWIMTGIFVALIALAVLVAYRIGIFQWLIQTFPLEKAERMENPRQSISPFLPTFSYNPQRYPHPSVVVPMKRPLSGERLTEGGK